MSSQIKKKMRGWIWTSLPSGSRTSGAACWDVCWLSDCCILSQIGAIKFKKRIYIYIITSLSGSSFKLWNCYWFKPKSASSTSCEELNMWQPNWYYFCLFSVSIKHVWTDNLRRHWSPAETRDSLGFSKGRRRERNQSAPSIRPRKKTWIIHS